MSFKGHLRRPIRIQMFKIIAESCLLAEIAMIIALRGATSSPANSSKIQPSDAGMFQCNKPPTNNCSCHCNVYQDSGIGDAVKALEARMDHLIELVNKIATPASQPAPTAADAVVSSCKEVYDKDNSSKSQVYEMTFGSQKIPVYCHMGDLACGDGGWTLAMKTDGAKRTFDFDSHLWSDKYTFNIVGGQTGFDMQETKLPTYWSTPFSKICLGMKIGQQLKFIVLRINASSLFSLIADGNYRATSLGRNTWKTLIGCQASLQLNCNHEGFNAVGGRQVNSKARIGILGNNQNHCGTCDSRIGFGTGGHPDNSNTCGNEAADLQSDNGPKSIKAMGYILVQ